MGGGYTNWIADVCGWSHIRSRSFKKKVQSHLHLFVRAHFTHIFISSFFSFSRVSNRAAYLKTHLPWAVRVGIDSKFLMNVYYEQRWDQNIDELRSELNIEIPP